MKRRDFITLLGATAAWPLCARAAAGGADGRLPQAWFARRAYRCGIPPGPEGNWVRRRTERNVAIEYRWANDQREILSEMAVDLVRRRVAVIVAAGVPAALAAKAATTKIPIVFLIGNDPITVRLVPALNRPGGNVTGVTNIAVGLTAKRLELLHELVPKVGTVAVLLDPTGLTVEATKADLEEAARALGLHLVFLNASSDSDFDPAFATFAQQQVGALLLTDETLFNNHRERLVALAARHAVPVIYAFREFTAAGGLMSYSSSLMDANQLTGVYAGRILKGEMPGDLPVLQPTKFDLVVNLKAAKAIGLTIPEAFLLRADEVIE